MDQDIQELVNEALNNALENGYDNTELDPFAVACDLCDRASDLENYNPQDLVEYVVAWQKR